MLNELGYEVRLAKIFGTNSIPRPYYSAIFVRKGVNRALL